MIGDTVLFFPSTIKNVPLFDLSHTQTPTNVHKALKTRGLTGKKKNWSKKFTFPDQIRMNECV